MLVVSLNMHVCLSRLYVAKMFDQYLSYIEKYSLHV